MSFGEELSENGAISVESFEEDGFKRRSGRQIHDFAIAGTFY